MDKDLRYAIRSLLRQPGFAAITVLTLALGVVPTDVSTFVVVCFSLFIVALVACYLPARRATRIDPLIALRNE